MFKNPGNKLETIAYVWFFIRIIIGIMLVISAISFLRSAVYLGLDVGNNTFGIVLVGVAVSIFQVAIAYFESLILCCIASVTINTEYIADKMEESKIPNRETREVIEEVQRMKADPTMGKTYTDVDEMMKDLLKLKVK